MRPGLGVRQRDVQLTGSVRTRTRLLSAFAGAAIAACGGSTNLVGNASPDAGGDGGNGTDGGGDGSTKGPDDSGTDGSKLGRVPLVHRAAPVECSHTRGAGNSDPQAPGTCLMDADCTTGTNGRCLLSTHGARLNSCSYDRCFLDSECGGKVCTCRETAIDVNRCAEGNCKVDADCGAAGYCSPSVPFDRINTGTGGYYCHTAADECVDDADCPQAPNKAKCAFDPTKSHWACSTGQFLPP